MELVLLYMVWPMVAYVAICYLASYIVYDKNCFLDMFKPFLKEAPDASTSDLMDQCECGYTFHHESLKTIYTAYNVDFIVCPECGRETEVRKIMFDDEKIA